MTENEPIHTIEFKKHLYEQELRKLFAYIHPSIRGSILYGFRDEGILSKEKLETIVFKGCEGDIHSEDENITLRYLLRKDNSGLYQRMKLYYNPEQGNNKSPEMALEVAKKIQKKY